MKQTLANLRAANTVTDRAAKIFLFPGDAVCEWLKVKDDESRFLLRMFVNLTVYGKIAILLMLSFL